MRYRTGTALTQLNPPTSTDRGKLYVYRPKAFKGGGVSYQVHVNENNLGKLINHSYLSTELPAGEYEVWAKTEARKGIHIRIGANEIVCVKGGISFGFVVGRPKFEQVSLEQCKRELIGLPGWEAPNSSSISSPMPKTQSTTPHTPSPTPSIDADGGIPLKPIN